MATKLRCPKCNQLNDPGATHCAFCRAPLVQYCPICGTPRPWYVPRCARCDAASADAQSFADLFRGSFEQRLVRDRYILREPLSSGRVTAIYRATDSQSSQTVCIKEISAVAMFRPEERREAERALYATLERWARVEHAGLARILDWFAERDRYYVILEFVNGWSGQRLIEESNLRVTPDLARNWGAQLADALYALHSQDPPLYAPFLAPAHFIVNPEGVVKLVGFGLGQFFNPTAYGPYGSLPGYTAPELGRVLPSPLTDCFALGRTLYALLIKYPLEKGLARPIPLRQAVPGISAQLVRAIARAAERDPAQRYASLAELRDALWEPPRGALAPVRDWFAQASATSETTRPILTPPTAASPTPSMAELGFIPDPRYGPQPVPAPAKAVVQEAAQALPRLSVQPLALKAVDLKMGEKRRLVLKLRNAGEGEWAGHIVSHVSWLRAPTQTFRLPPGKQAQIVVTLSADGLTPGRTIEPQALSIEGNAGRQWVGITAETYVGPVLEVEPLALDFGTFQGEGRGTLALTVRNIGRQMLTGQAVSRLPWLRPDPAAFRCPPGGALRLQVHAEASKMPRGQQSIEEGLLLDTDGGQARIAVRAWRQVAELDLGALHMDFGTVRGGELAERLLFIGNTGDAPLVGHCRSLVPWLQVSPQEIHCPPGDLVQCTATLDASAVPDGLLEVPQAVRVQTNGGVATLSLRAQVVNPLPILETPHLDFGTVRLGESATRPLTLRNEGSAPFDAHLLPQIEWLLPEREWVHCPPHERVTLSVRANTALFERGQRLEVPTALRIAAGGQAFEVSASLLVEQAALHVEPDEVDFGYLDPAEPATRIITLANEGTGPLAWVAQTDALWVEISPREGACAPGESVSLSLTAYALAIEPGMEPAQGALIISSDGGRAKIPLRAGIASPRLSTDTTRLDLGPSRNFAPVNGSFRLFNYGLGTLKGTLRTDRLWLVLDRVSFECATGRSVEIRVHTDMEEFPADAAEDTALITVESNGGSLQLELTLRVERVPELEIPQEVRLAAPEPGAAPQGRLVLHNRGLAAAHVTLWAEPPYLALPRDRVDIKPGKSVRLAVQWNGPYPPTEACRLGIQCGEEVFFTPVILSS